MYLSRIISGGISDIYLLQNVWCVIRSHITLVLNVLNETFSGSALEPFCESAQWLLYTINTHEFGYVVWLLHITPCWSGKITNIMKAVSSSEIFSRIHIDFDLLCYIELETKITVMCFISFLALSFVYSVNMVVIMHYLTTVLMALEPTLWQWRKISQSACYTLSSDSHNVDVG
jgi:hypothetical protein